MIKSISHNQISVKDRSVGKTGSVQADQPDYPAGHPGPVVLLLLDGWGIAPPSEANAISAALLPFFLKLLKEYPVAAIATGAKSLNQRYLALGSGREGVVNNAPVTTLSKILSAASLKQLKIVEAERLVALTNYFNGQEEQPGMGEEWQILSGLTNPSSSTPASQLAQFSRTLLKAVKKGGFSFIAAAIPVLDMAAASGEASTVQAAAQLDKFLKKIVPAVLEKQGTVLISSAHGNAEKIRDLLTDLPDKEMTDNPVPLVIVGEKFKGKVIGGHDLVDGDLSLLMPAGTLADVAPTILDIMNLPPAEMSGRSLLA